MTRRVLMVHALGGMRGPARTISLLAPRVAETCDVIVAAPEGFLLASVRGLPSVRACALPVRRSRAGSWFAGVSHISRFVNDHALPSLIHANGLSALNLAAPIALRRRLPVLVHFHGYEAGLRARLLAKSWSRLGLRMSLVPVSEQSRGVLIDAGLGEYVGAILPNPVSVLRQRLGEPTSGDIRVGFVGSPSRRKGLHLLTDIALRLRDLPVRWMVVGIEPGCGSSYVDACREQLFSAGIAGRVEWRGVVRDLRSAFGQMDVLLVPSLEESWCRVAMEGMAAGLPVVGTDIPGMAELFARVPGALTFPIGRPEVGAQHVRLLAADPRLRRAIGQAGRDAVKAFDADVVASRLLSLYEQLLSEPEVVEPTS